MMIRERMGCAFLRTTLLVAMVTAGASGGEKQIVSLRDMSRQELKSAGFLLDRDAPVHVLALGAGGDYGWTYHSDEMTAYAWIINADTREVVWQMTVDNSSKSHDDRSFDGDVPLRRGAYEVYFAAAVFTYHTAFSHIRTNIDHRNEPLFGDHKSEKKNFFNWFKSWWSDDISKEWQKRSTQWGIDLLVDASVGVTPFSPPRERANVVLKATGLGDNVTVRKGFTLAGATTLSLYAIGEGQGDNEPADYGWIVNAANRKRVWEMQIRRCSQAGGASKNLLYTDDVTLPKGEYVLYYITDGSHSEADWNDNPPFDPLNWGITISVNNGREREGFKIAPYTEDRNVFVSLVKIRDNETRSQGFSLRDDAEIRIYAFGERNNSRRTMVDYGSIINARTREKVWTMDVDRTYHGGGAAKNRLVDEVIDLPRGSYVVYYHSDDSHSYDDWNADPPFDPEHYGITLMGAGDQWNPSVVTKYTEERDKGKIAQIIRVGDNADRSESFSLDKTTRVRVYAIGEGQNREMYDYGWIEDAHTGKVVWQMTYGMTFHAGGARKNRMVNTTILLDRGEYRLRYKSDDSHAYGDWNSEPPEDEQYWGITLYRDTGMIPLPPVPGEPPPDIPGDNPDN
jgi:hypothetical protein